MFGKMLSGISGKIRSEFRRNLKNNEHYRENHWNLPERVQVYCSTHYLKALLFLWAAAYGLIVLAEYLRPLLLPFARQHLSGAEDLPGWMSSLLGSQVTLIGIVFPLVVGLISVLFQKKSSRIHIQSAYQLHSGYMFSGLSGLSLAAFILVEGLFFSLGDKYTNIVFSVTAFLWMLFNILLAMWFFISSLNVLDDRKRDRVMLKYFHSQIMVRNIQESLIRSWMNDPGRYIDQNKLKNLRVLPYYLSGNKEMSFILLRMKRKQVVQDVYLRPMFFLLSKLKELPDGNAEIVLLPSIRQGNDSIAVLACSGLNPSGIWGWLFRLCFRRGYMREVPESSNIARDLYGEAYDLLGENNISAFESATERMIKTYTSLKNSFSYKDGNYLDECEIVHNYLTFSDSFYTVFWEFCQATVKTTETSRGYFRRVMDIPSLIYGFSEDKKISDFQHYIKSLFAVWYALINWRSGYGETLSISQNQRHRELVKDFIGEWEIWSVGQHNAKDPADTHAHRLLYHLSYAPRIAMLAITAGDRFAADHATDMLILWLNQTRLERDWQAEHSWHSYFLTPYFLDLPHDGPEWIMVLKGNAYSENAARSIIFSNALTDIRLLTAGYILTNLKPKKNDPLNKVVNRLLNSGLAFPTGAHERLTDKFTGATDIIDGIIRLEYRTADHGSRWYGMLTEMVNSFSSYNERQQISGRIYMGDREDVRNMYASYAEVAIMLSSSDSGVSRRVSQALKDNLFSYHNKLQIVLQLERLKRDPEIYPAGESVSQQAVYDEKTLRFNETLDAYIYAFTESMSADVLGAEEDTVRMRNTDMMLTEKLHSMLAENALFSHFEFSYKETFNSPLETKIVRVKMNREFIARDINSNFSGELMPVDSVKCALLDNLHNLLGRLPAGHSENINDAAVFCRKICEMTYDEPDCTVIISGTRFVDDLLGLSYQRDRHEELGISVDHALRESGALPFRINNCTVYHFWSAEDNHSLLVRNSSFKEFAMFRYPDGTLFATFWRTSDENPLEGILSTVWDPEMEVTGTVVAKINHR